MENELEEIQTEQEADAKPLFTSEVTHDLPSRKEVTKRYTQLQLSGSVREIMVGIMLVVLFAYLFLYQKSYVFYARTYFVFVVCYWGAQLFGMLRGRNGGPAFKRMLANNGGKPIHNLITFTDEGYSVLNTYQESSSDYTYDRIRSVAESENFFLLYRDMTTCTVVAKNTITGGTEQEFLDFLRQRCTNWESGKLQENRFGTKVRIAMIILWVLFLALAVYGLFLV